MSAPAALLLTRALEAPGLLDACTAYQDGEAFNRYRDGDVAASQGHLSLLQLKRTLCDHCLGEVADVEAGCRDSLGPEEEEEGGDSGSGGNTLNDMRFTHCAVDWAATQGHLEVVRHASVE